MFTYFIIPEWVFIVGIVVSSIVCVLLFLAIKKEDNAAGRKTPYYLVPIFIILILAFSGLIIILLGGALSINSSSTTDDPSNATGQLSSFTVNEKEMSNRIEKEADLNNVKLADKDKSEMAETFKDGKFVDFVADSDEKIIKGFVYFEDNNMKISVDKEMKDSEIIVVPIN